MIRLADVDENNFEALRRLDVAPEQRRFLDSPLGILARGYVYRTQRARVLAILGETMTPTTLSTYCGPGNGSDDGPRVFQGIPRNPGRQFVVRNSRCNGRSNGRSDA